MRSGDRVSTIARLLIATVTVSAAAGDWPMWRYDAGRTANAPGSLPPALHLHWVREYSERVQVWDDPLNHDLMPYDKVFEPIVLGERMFFGFNDRDKVVALDTRTGRELWTFYTDGPVRLPPAAGLGRVYFTSDDGCLYCVDAAEGKLIWKFRGGPSSRKAVGNGRLVSAWPARGGPVIRDGIVYFAASIWPFMGTFLYALDAESGSVVWVNDSTGADYIKQPHSAPSFAGVGPQGALVATKDVLLVPGGRSVPAAFDRKTGELLHFEINAGGKGNGGSLVMADDSEFFAHTRRRGVRAYDLRTGKKGSFVVNEPVLGPHYLYAGQDHSSARNAVLAGEVALESARYSVVKAKGDHRDAMQLADPDRIEKAREKVVAAEAKLAQVLTLLDRAKEEAADSPGAVIQCVGRDRKVRWEIEADGTGDIIRVGDRLYAAGAESLLAVELPGSGREAKVVWSHPVEGRVQRLLAADQRLFAVTQDGRIMAFGAGQQQVSHSREERLDRQADPDASRRARKLLEQWEASEGYALWFGAADPGLLEAVVAGSDLQVVVVETDPAKVAGLRARLDAAGLYGTRVSVHEGNAESFGAPPYIAHLVVVSGGWAGGRTDGELGAIYQSVRPYGGVLWVDCAAEERADLGRRFERIDSRQARLIAEGEGLTVKREGALPGAADWTHQYGDIANTVKSDDQTVRLPLGVLWFGGSSNLDVLPRHGHGPSEQVVGGRLFIEGMRSLSARDVYTGRVLWKTDLPDLDTFGVYYDETYADTPLSTIYNQKHIPGANARGANFAATEDTVYVAVGSECRLFSARTGELVKTIGMPGGDAGAEAPRWGYLGVYGDILLGGVGFANYNRRHGTDAGTGRTPITDLTASAGLMAFDRFTGEVLWRVEARHGFLHNGIVAGGGRVYCLDRLPGVLEAKLKRRGRKPPSSYRIAAFDARSGEMAWEQPGDVFGTWLAYSVSRDLLLQAGAQAPDRLIDEVGQGMAVYRGTDGSEVWKIDDLEYSGPCILHHDLILTTPASYKVSSGAFNLMDGSPHLVPNPLTGKLEPWRITRTYGCNTPVASEHLLTFRSGAAGFYDLERRGGTGNFGGFKSGCSANLIIANGVLNAPDYTRTCTCAYQNQTSLGLVHMPDIEVWTYNVFNASAETGERIEKLGINLGAPGDRMAVSGTLWLDYPTVGGGSANLDVVIRGEQTRPFRRHASRLTGAGLPWVTASGVLGAESIAIKPASQEKADQTEAGAASVARRTPSETGAISHPYTVRLFFAEPDDLRAGERVFTVGLQGRDVLADFDILACAGGKDRGVVREFRGVMLDRDLVVTLRAAAGSKRPPLICGIELIAEEPGGGLGERETGLSFP